MTETYTDNGALVTWSNPQCPFVIEYSRKALDDIRLAVVDAFFSLPRGGAEIGGILLGRFEGQRLQILDYAPIECEHAFGPAFTLSPADQTRLGELLQQSFPGGQRPVGWYHSHTRTEISLCEADLDIHNRYFPEQWQVALVLKPSTLQPTQAGFFFREPNGSIHAERSYQEFVVEALPLQPVSTSGPPPVPGPMRETEADAVVLTLPSAEMPAPYAAEPHVPAAEIPIAEPAPQPILTATPEPQPAAEPTPEPDRNPGSESPNSFRAFESHEEPPHTEKPPIPEKRVPVTEPPAFSSYTEEAQPQRHWLGIAAALVAGLALGVLADQARSHSQPPVAVQAAPVRTDAGSKRETPASADAALRKRTEELSKQVADLSQQNHALRQENLELTKQQANSARQQADSAKQQADFAKQQGEAGKQQSELRQQRDDLLRQTAKLKTDLTTQTARVQSLQQQLDDLRRQQQRRRLSIQSSDPLP